MHGGTPEAIGREATRVGVPSVGDRMSAVRKPGVVRFAGGRFRDAWVSRGAARAGRGRQQSRSSGSGGPGSGGRVSAVRGPGRSGSPWWSALRAGASGRLSVPTRCPGRSWSSAARCWWPGVGGPQARRGPLCGRAFPGRLGVPACCLGRPWASAVLGSGDAGSGGRVSAVRVPGTVRESLVVRFAGGRFGAPECPDALPRPAVVVSGPRAPATGCRRSGSPAWCVLRAGVPEAPGCPGVLPGPAVGVSGSSAGPSPVPRVPGSCRPRGPGRRSPPGGGPPRR